MDLRKILGKSGEDIVSDLLEKEKFTILDRNYKKRFGEIDIIASKKDLLVFVEVKMRRNPLFDLSYLISPSKQKKIISVAKEYIARYDHSQKVCRFDVALIEGTRESHRVTYIPNAFVEQEYY